MYQENKRMMGEYEILHAMRIGDKEIVLGENPKNTDGLMYVCGYCERNSIIARYSEVMGSDDFAEMAELYGKRIAEQAAKTRAYFLQPTQQGIDDAPITPAGCTVIDDSTNLNDKVVVIRSDALRPEYRRATCQLQLCIGGSGALANSRGSAVYCIDLYTGQKSRYERRSVLGVMEQLPQWAKDNLPSARQKNAKDREER